MSFRMASAPCSSRCAAAEAPSRAACASAASLLISDSAGAVERGHDGVQLEVAGLGRNRDAADGHLTPASKCRHQRAFGFERGTGVGSLTRATASRVDVVAGANLDGDDALSRRRNASRPAAPPRCAIRIRADAGRLRQAPAGRIAVVELAQPRVEIAADVLEARVRKQPFELRDAAHAAGADRAPAGSAARTASTGFCPRG